MCIHVRLCRRLNRRASQRIIQQERRRKHDSKTNVEEKNTKHKKTNAAEN